MSAPVSPRQLFQEGVSGMPDKDRAAQQERLQISKVILSSRTQAHDGEEARQKTRRGLGRAHGLVSTINRNEIFNSVKMQSISSAAESAVWCRQPSGEASISPTPVPYQRARGGRYQRHLALLSYAQLVQSSRIRRRDSWIDTSVYLALAPLLR